MRELVTKVIARIHSFANDCSSKDCVVPENIHTPAPSTEGTIALGPPPPWNFHSRGCLSDLEFQLG